METKDNYCINNDSDHTRFRLTLEIFDSIILYELLIIIIAIKSIISEYELLTNYRQSENVYLGTRATYVRNILDHNANYKLTRKHIQRYYVGIEIISTLS